MAHLRIFRHYVHTPFLLMSALEFVILALSGLLAHDVSYRSTLPGPATTAPTVAFAVTMLAAMAAMGVYESRIREGYLAMMLRTAVVLLVLTAGGGLVMAAMRFTGKPRPPHWLAMLHGLLAGAAVTLIAYTAFTSTLPGQAWLGLLLLAVAAVGGVFLNLKFHMHEIALPISIVLIHAVVAAAGLVLVAMAAWAQ